MPIGLKIVAALFILIGSMLLIPTIGALQEFGTLSDSLMRSGIPITVFLLTNFAFPIIMIVGGIGLWRCSQGAWWICAAIAGFEISKKIITAFVAPQSLFGANPLIRNIFLICAIAILFYLFKPSIFSAFHRQSLSRQKVIGILALVSFVAGGFLFWQEEMNAGAIRNYEAMPSNVPHQTTPNNGATQR
jgi:hypothetical protein